MKKAILSIILLSSFSVAQALEFKSFNFNDESDCAEQLGQLAVSLPYDIIDVNHLSKSKEICLQAYIGDNACRKEYYRQKEALGLISGIRSNHSSEQEAQAKQQCGGWLKQRRSSCESFLQQASNVCYQLDNGAETQQQKEAQELADNLIGSWSGDYDFTYSSGNSGHMSINLNINRKISDSEFSGIMQSQSQGWDCGAKQRMTIKVYDNVAYLQGTVLSTTCKGWSADNFELSINDGVMRGSNSDTNGANSNSVTLRKQ